MNADQFNVWKDTFNVAAPTLTPLITQTPLGMLELATAWENKVPNANRCIIRLHQMLKNDNILTKLIGERNFAYWLDALNKVFDDVPDGTSDYKMTMVIRNSIAKPEDKRNTQGMTGERHYHLPRT